MLLVAQIYPLSGHLVSTMKETMSGHEFTKKCDLSGLPQLSSAHRVEYIYAIKFTFQHQVCFDQFFIFKKMLDSRVTKCPAKHLDPAIR